MSDAPIHVETVIDKDQVREFAASALRTAELMYEAIRQHDPSYVLRAERWPDERAKFGFSDSFRLIMGVPHERKPGKFRKVTFSYDLGLGSWGWEFVVYSDLHREPFWNQDEGLRKLFENLMSKADYEGILSNTRRPLETSQGAA